MTGVLLPNGGSLYGEGTVDPGVCGATGTGILLPNGGRLYGAEPCASPDPALPAPLTDAVVVLQASSINPATFTDGDDWPNEGTAGAAYDAVVDPASTAGDPAYSPSPEPGFTMGGSGDPPNYRVPNGSAIDPASGSFTFATRLTYLGPDSFFEPVAAKITGNIGVDATGWAIATGTVVAGGSPGVAILVESGGAPVGAASTDELVADTEYLIVARLDRDTDTLGLFINGTNVATADASSIGSITSTNPIIISRSTTAEQTHYDEAYWDRALTDNEITVQLPVAFAS